MVLKRYMFIALGVLIFANMCVLASVSSTSSTISTYQGSQRAQSEMTLFAPWLLVHLFSAMALIHGVVLLFRMFFARAFVSRMSVLLLCGFVVLAILPILVFNRI